MHAPESAIKILGGYVNLDWHCDLRDAGVEDRRPIRGRRSGRPSLVGRRTAGVPRIRRLPSVVTGRRPSYGDRRTSCAARESAQCQCHCCLAREQIESARRMNRQNASQAPQGHVQQHATRCQQCKGGRRSSTPTLLQLPRPRSSGTRLFVAARLKPTANPSFNRTCLRQAG